MLTSRDDKGATLDDQDLYFCFDCTAHHNIGKLQQCFVNADGDQLEKSCKQLYISIDEESLHARKTRIRSGTSFDQMEYLSLVSREEYGKQLPVIKRLHYKGTNSGNKIGDVEWTSLDNAWNLTHKQKLDLLGPYRVEVGGKTKGAGEMELQRAKRKGATDMEPAFWHGRPPTLYHELIHSYQLKAIVDLSPGDGTLAVLCCKLRVPYLGFTLTDVHTELVKHYCLQQLLVAACTEGDKLYEPDLALMFKTPAGGISQQGPMAKRHRPTELITAGASNSSGTTSGANTSNILETFKKKVEELKKKKLEEDGGAGDKDPDDEA